MNSIITRFVCRCLIASLIVLPWQAQAGLIGTDQALNAAQQRAAQATVGAVIERDDVAAQLERLGVSPQAAKERVAALSDAQVADLAGRIDALPAGGNSLLLIIVIVVLFYWFAVGQPASAKAPAKAPAKPAPEKK